ncbi:DEAD/DEAH box helicase [Paenibacillus apiarius]|uniref:DEAD/DEAH box helicase n=1 Tax=Paenibacillus apiarius TaxID=46240 RepID=UPI003B3B7647
MIERALSWMVEIRRRGDGSFFIFNTGLLRNIQALKHMLFAWHAPSFYGTMLRTEEDDRKEGIVVTASELLEMVTQPASVRWAEVVQGGSFRVAARTAKLYEKIVAEGRFQPSFTKWKQGAFGWDLLLTESEQAEQAELLEQARDLESEGAGLADWFDGLMAEQLQQRDEHSVLWRRAVSARPELETLRLPAERSPWWDERDWLNSIRWERDDTPFRVILRLDEPEEDRGPWRLHVLVQDKNDSNHQLACRFDGVEGTGDEETEARISPAIGSFPDTWMPFIAPRLKRDVGKVLQILPWLADGDDSRRLKTRLSETEAWQFLADGSLLLAEAGFHVVVPAWWQRVRQLKTRLKAKLTSSSGSSSASMIGLEHMVQFDWKLAVGDLQLSEAEFRSLIEEDRRLVRLHGQWIQLNPEEVEQIRSMMKKVGSEGVTLGEVLELHLSAERARLEEELGEDVLQRDNEMRLEMELNDQLQQFIGNLQHHSSVPQCEAPAALQGSLRAYQAEGYSWLMFMRRFGLGACLADDMGLGKTIQWIAYLLRVKEEAPVGGPSLLICPTSLIGNWQKELQRFAPQLRVRLHYGPNRTRGAGFLNEIKDADVVITTYTLALLDREQLRMTKWNSLCLDEAQNIKNPYAKQSVAIRKLDAHHRIALTGTPMENRLIELWSIMDFLNPGYLGTLSQFRRTYVNPIERTHDAEWTMLVQRLVQPFLLRRLKKDPEIQLHLPEKNESKVYVPLTAEQASVYEQTLQQLFGDLEQLGTMERRGRILAALTKLKQVCNHPGLLQKEASARSGPERSGKLIRLLEMLAELRAEKERSLIFTQYAETGRLLQSMLAKELGEQVPFLHGGVAKADRDSMVQHFQDETLPDDERPGVFILSLKAGGTGLNLTAANHVFHYDRWWNPAVENQASDRAYRIGQTRNVQVYKLIALGTLEERIDDMIEQKQALSEQIIGAGDKWITELSTTELRELFALRSQWMD